MKSTRTFLLVGLEREIDICWRAFAQLLAVKFFCKWLLVKKSICLHKQASTNSLHVCNFFGLHKCITLDFSCGTIIRQHGSFGFKSY